jgi:hypothetical protein
MFFISFSYIPYIDQISRLGVFCVAKYAAAL